MQQCAASVLTQFYPLQLGAFAVDTLDIYAKTKKKFGKANASVKGSRSFGFSFSKSVLSWVFFEGDRSVEDNLFFSAVRINREVTNSFKLEFVKGLCSLD